jgi:Arc/MetJ family transcription regulator
MNIYRYLIMYIQTLPTWRCAMAKAMTSIRLDTQLADEAAKVLGVKSRTEAVHIALREIVALKKFKNLMTKHAGKFSFEGLGE